MQINERPLPIATKLTRPYWDGAKRGLLLVQECNACGSKQFYPRTFCVKCMSDDLHWHRCSGQGRIYTFTINRRAAGEHWKDKVPYVVAIVRLDEGLLMMGNVVGSEALGVKIGSRVHVVYEKINNEVVLPQFELVKDLPQNPPVRSRT